MLDNKSHMEVSLLPTNKSFGMTFAYFFLILAVIKFRSMQFATAYLLLCIGVVLLSVTLLFPILLAPCNKAWATFGLFLHKVTTPVILALLYFLLFVPLGMLMRVFGWDPLRLKYDAKTNSYWQPRAIQAEMHGSMRNQF